MTAIEYIDLSTDNDTIFTPTLAAKLAEDYHRYKIKPIEFPEEQPEVLAEYACNQLDITLEEIRLKSRLPRIAQRRGVVMWYLRKRTKLTLREVGLLLGKKDHATVHRWERKLDQVEKRFDPVLYKLKCKLI